MVTQPTDQEARQAALAERERQQLIDRGVALEQEERRRRSLPKNPYDGQTQTRAVELLRQVDADREVRSRLGDLLHGYLGDVANGRHIGEPLAKRIRDVLGAAESALAARRAEVEAQRREQADMVEIEVLVSEGIGPGRKHKGGRQHIPRPELGELEAWTSTLEKQRDQEGIKVPRGFRRWPVWRLVTPP